MKPVTFFWITCTLGLGSALGVNSATPSITLAREGRALQPIVVSPKASGATRAVAAELGQYLERITGARFEVQSGDGSRGIVVGTISESCPSSGFEDSEHL